MAKFGDIVTYDGLVYRVVAVSADTEPTYTLEPLRSDAELPTRTVSASDSQLFLIPSGGARLTAIAGADIVPVSKGTAVSQALADGLVRVKFESNGGSDVAAQIIDIGDGVTEPDDPTYEGFTFDGWFNDDETFADAVDFVADTFDDDTILYAGWTEVEA